MVKKTHERAFSTSIQIFTDTFNQYFEALRMILRIKKNLRKHINLNFM